MTILSLELAARYGAYPALLGRNILYLVKENLASCCVKSQSNTEKMEIRFHHHKGDHTVCQNTLDEDSVLRLTMVTKTLERKKSRAGKPALENFRPKMSKPVFFSEKEQGYCLYFGLSYGCGKNREQTQRRETV